MDRSTALRAGLIQLAAVAVTGALLGVLLGHHFFEDNGVWAGPAAWIACAAFTGAMLRLPLSPVLIGAVLAGLPSGLMTALGLHWEGALVAIILFALWCGRLRRDPRLVEDAL